MTDIQRSTRKGDLNCQKFMGVLTGILGTISGILSLKLYADGCFRNLPDTTAAGGRCGAGSSRFTFKLLNN